MLNDLNVDLQLKHFSQTILLCVCLTFQQRGLLFAANTTDRKLQSASSGADPDGDYNTCQSAPHINFV